jgi:hypothetical protein
VSGVWVLWRWLLRVLLVSSGCDCVSLPGFQRHIQNFVGLLFLVCNVQPAMWNIFVCNIDQLQCRQNTEHCIWRTCVFHWSTRLHCRFSKTLLFNTGNTLPWILPLFFIWARWEQIHWVGTLHIHPRTMKIRLFISDQKLHKHTRISTFTRRCTYMRSCCIKGDEICWFYVVFISWCPI